MLRATSRVALFPKQMPTTTARVGGDQNYQLKFRSVRSGLAHKFRFSKSRRIARRVLQYAVVMVILILYSGNIVSAMIRRALGASF